MTGSANAVGVVEQLLDHAGHGRWERLPDVLTEDYVILEPAGLPWGGTHKGSEGYAQLMQTIGSTFELNFESPAVHPLGNGRVLLEMHVTFTSRVGSGACRTKVLELLTLTNGKISRSDVLLQDAVTVAQLAAVTG